MRNRIIAATAAVVLLVSGISTSALWLTKQSTSQTVQALTPGVLEDCDNNGYDDLTGDPVPWYGFDETRGDTVPSDWDGVSGSYTYKNESSLGQGYTPGNSSSSSSNSNSNNSSNSSSNSNSNSSSNSSNSASNSSSSTSNSNSNTSSTAQQYAAELAPKSAEYIASLPPEVQNIINTKGTLNFEGSAVKAPDNSGAGGRVEPGDTITIAGSGFAPNTPGFVLKIYSTVLRLGTASTDAAGNLSLNATIPADFETGEHTIALFYEDVIMYKRTLQVGDLPVEVADTSPTATATELPTNNNNLLLGSIILGVLAVAAAAVFFVKSQQNKLGGSDTSSYTPAH